MKILAKVFAVTGLIMSLASLQARADQLVDRRVPKETQELSTKVDELDNQWREENISNGGSQVIQLARLEGFKKPELAITDRNLKTFAVDTFHGNFHQNTSDEIDSSTLPLKSSVKAFSGKGDVIAMSQAVAMAMSYSIGDRKSVNQKISEISPIVEALGMTSENSRLAKACIVTEIDGTSTEIVQFVLVNMETRTAIVLYAAQGSMDGSNTAARLCR